MIYSLKPITCQGQNARTEAAEMSITFIGPLNTLNYTKLRG